jgi:hypothetical protein
MICTVDFDTACYVGDEEDGVYYAAAEGPDGWYFSAVVDCSSAGFTMTLCTDDGPHADENKALSHALTEAQEWCLMNNVLITE